MARKKTAKIDKQRLRKQYGENFDIFETIIDNGVIVKMQELVYPIFMLPGAFAVGGQQKKGSAAFDVALFMEQNNLVKRPNKSKIRKALKDTLRKMLITKAIIEDDYVLDPETNERAYAYDESAVVSTASVSALDRALKRQMKKKLDTYDNIDQKDAHLVKAYAKAIKDLAAYLNSVGKKYEEHKEEFDRLARIRPQTYKESKRKPKKRRKTTVQKQQVKKKQAQQKQQRITKLTQSQIERQAKAYLKLENKRGVYSSLKKKYGEKGAKSIVKRSKSLAKQQAKKQK
jgi:hypothetical protein